MIKKNKDLAGIVKFVDPSIMRQVKDEFSLEMML